ncbi:MAG: glycosyltransferase [Planctomycetota bacterium]
MNPSRALDHEPLNRLPVVEDETGEPAAPKVLVLVVSYESERHIVEVFERVPGALFNRDDVTFLYLDDASSDGGPARLRGWLSERGIGNVLVARNPQNQGYGGNQKIGYRYAVENGYDLVVLLHGDGQYAPEMLPRFIEVYREDRADVILGTRMHSTQSARAGGMPWHKVVGNRFLTWYQNKLTGLELSEYHTGYRAYSTAFLRSVPVGINTNDFHFDTQILLQAANVGALFREINIPTHYGDEVCRVNGVAYGLHVMASTLRYRLHRSGMMCSVRYRRLTHGRYEDKGAMSGSSHAVALSWVEALSPGTLTDLGCGPGYVARACEAKGVRVTGVDREPPLEGTMTRFVRFDLETGELPVDAFESDGVLLLDVIEHLAEPEHFLIDLRERSLLLAEREGRPFVVLSTPNIAFITMRLNLLLGRFTYADRGILDVTHKRLFNRRTLLRTLRDCGYEVERSRGLSPPFGLALGGGGVTRGLNALGGVLARVWPSLFAFQMLVLCRPKPSTRSLLSHIYRQGGEAAAEPVEAGEVRDAV